MGSPRPSPRLWTASVSHGSSLNKPANNKLNALTPYFQLFKQTLCSHIFCMGDFRTRLLLMDVQIQYQLVGYELLSHRFSTIAFLVHNFVNQHLYFRICRIMGPWCVCIKHKVKLYSLAMPTLSMPLYATLP